ncbi:PPE domain-containing protein [Amycolatopsis alkalitolerans]|uniref:PPE domain-containing protein n=1 Tax=Amycolatopsis alkalitolerans TaxID=2547244 RepID=UPI001356980D|nr:hypothetical protein [Amycolatopsis alkalitolerans]
MAIGTVIMPGAGTVIGGMTGGLISLFSSPEAQQQQANVGGRSIDARQIWEQIHPGSSDSLHDGAKAAGTLQSVHDNRASQIDAINKAMDAAWQGDASQQVQAGAHPLGVWLRDSSANLQKSGTYLTDQGHAFDSAKSQVQEIAATPPHESLLDHVNPFSDKEDEINKYNQQGQTNVQAFQNYYNASAQNAAGMPQYSAWTGNNFSSNNPNNPNNPSNNPNIGTTPPPSASLPPSGLGNPPNIGNTPPRYNTKLPSTTDPNQGKYQTSLPNTDSYKPPAWNDATTAAGYTPSTTNPDFSSGFGPSGSGSGSGSGAGSGGYGGGSLAGAGFGPAGSLGGGASTGAGASGAADGAAGAGRGGVGGGAGASGRAGSPGMGGMGRGAGGKGGDDEEHQTKYLVGDDPNELFGTDELTAPPVIGE